MRPIRLPPAAQGKQIPGKGDASNQCEERIEATFHELQRAYVKAIYHDVGTAGEQDNRNDGQGDRNALFLVPMEGAAAELILVLYGHDRTTLKNRKAPKTSASTIARSNRIGFTRTPPCSSRGFRGSSIYISSASPRPSLGFCRWKSVSRSCISPSFVSAFISEHDRRFYPIAKHKLHHCRGFQIFPNRNHPPCSLAGMKIVGLSLGVSDGQCQFLGIAHRFQQCAVELRMRQVCERNGRVVCLQLVGLWCIHTVEKAAVVLDRVVDIDSACRAKHPFHAHANLTLRFACTSLS